MLQTAPEQDSLLPGITRRVVLLAAGQLGLQIREQAPQVGQADLWQEAFVTSWYDTCLHMHHQQYSRIPSYDQSESTC